MCVNRQCVSSSLALKSKCAFTDQLIYQWNDYLVYFADTISKTCFEYFKLLEENKLSIYNYCVNDVGKDFCCESCTSNLKNSRF